MPEGVWRVTPSGTQVAEGRSGGRPGSSALKCGLPGWPFTELMALPVTIFYLDRQIGNIHTCMC